MRTTTIILAVLTAAAILSAPAEAAHRRHIHHHYSHHSSKHYWAAAPRQEAMGCVSDNSGRTICLGAGNRTSEARIETRRAVYDGNNNSARVVGGVSPECRPWYGVTCGCEVSLKVFGRVVNEPNLKQARVWGQVYPHVSPAIGMVAGRSSHVAYIQGGGPGAWELFDPNSGGRLNRIRISDLREFSWVVNPHASRMASR